MVLAPQSKYHHQGTPRSGAMAYHVAAIPTPAVCGDSGEVVHLEPPAPCPDLSCSTTVALFSSRVPTPLWYCHYQRSLQSRYCHYLITDWGTLGVGQTDLHQPMLGSPSLALGCQPHHSIIDSLLFILSSWLNTLVKFPVVRHHTSYLKEPMRLQNLYHDLAGKAKYGSS